MKIFIKFLLYLFIICFSSPIWGKIDEDINEKVEVNGIIFRYLPKTTQTTAFYVLKLDGGDTIKILTENISKLPKINKRYNVKGILINQNGEFIIIEKTNKCIDCLPLASISHFFSLKANYGLLLIILGCILIIITIIIFKRRTKPKYQRFHLAGASKQQFSAGITGFSPSGEFTTIRLQTNVPKTLRFIPGYFQIISGEDKGKTFRVPGYPTAEGNIVFIGSEEATGDSAPCYIQLKDKSVALKQAEIVNKEGKLFIKNLSQTNFTQINNIELKHNEISELKPGSVIKMGQIEFLYKI